MQTVDHNWRRLREEDRTLPEPQPIDMRFTEDHRLTQWFNNPQTQKFSWRSNLVPYTAWIELGQTWGLWRELENRLVEEIQADWVITHQHDYSIKKSTARDQENNPMINAKFLHIFYRQQLVDVFMILNGEKILTARTKKIQSGQQWLFREPVDLNTILCNGSQQRTSKNHG